MFTNLNIETQRDVAQAVAKLPSGANAAVQVDPTAPQPEVVSLPSSAAMRVPLRNKRAGKPGSDEPRCQELIVARVCLQKATGKNHEHWKHKRNSLDLRLGIFMVLALVVYGGSGI